jgi:hypothetical protein
MIISEKFTKSYYPFEVPTLLPQGFISAGLNVKKIGSAGGWRPRHGYTLINTVALENEVNSIFQYTNPKWDDYHLLVQTSGVIRDNTIVTEELLTESGETLLTEDGEPLLAQESGDPLAQAENLGGSIFSGVSGTPGFWAVVGEELIFADGSGGPAIFGGDTPTCCGFLVDDGSENISDYSLAVGDLSDSTYAIVPADASVAYYVCSKEIASSIVLNFGSLKNTNSVSVAVKAWRSGTWTSVGSLSDETDTAETHDTDGTLNWTAGTDEMRVLGNRMGYWYQVTFSGAPTVIHITTCRVTYSMARMTNKWDGTFQYATGAMFYDQSAGQYQDKLGLVSNDSEEQYMDISDATTSDFIYVKAPEKAVGFGFGIVTGKENVDNAQVDQIEYWNGSAWVAITALVDETLDGTGVSSFAQAGSIWIDQADYAVQRRTIGGDPVPGYWYRISWDASLGSSVQLSFIVYAARPEAFPTVTGCCEFDGKLVLWGMKNWPNRLLISPYDKPDQMTDLEGRLTYPFGGKQVIKAAASLGEYLLVLKGQGAFLMDKNYAILQLSSTVGIASPKTLAVAEVGTAEVRTEELIAVAMWQDLDGVYMGSAQQNIKKVSDSVRNYFDPEESEYIGADSITNLQGYISPYDGMYHLILSDKVLPYSILYSEWFPPWERALSVVTGTIVKGTDNKYTVLGGTSEGFLLNLASGTSDRDADNAEVAIEHYVRSRAIEFTEAEGILESLVRKLYGEFEVDSGTITTNFYGNRASAGTEIAIPSTMSLAQTGKASVSRYVDASKEAIWCFQVEFYSNTVNQVMKVTGFGGVLHPQTALGG